MLFTNFHLHVIYFPVGSWVTKHNRVLLLRIMHYGNSYVFWNGHLFSSRYACTLFILLCRWIMSRVVIWCCLLNHVMGKSLAQSFFYSFILVSILRNIWKLARTYYFCACSFSIHLAGEWVRWHIMHDLVVISVGSAKLFALTKSYISYLVVPESH